MSRRLVLATAVGFCSLTFDFSLVVFSSFVALNFVGFSSIGIISSALYSVMWFS